jgi:SAM-dependent methyltransferase
MKTIAAEDFHPDFNADLQIASLRDPYVAGHAARYMHTLKHMPVRKQFPEGKIRVLELGTSLVFPKILLDRLGFDEVEVTHFDSDRLGQEFKVDLPNDPQAKQLTAFSIDLESHKIPRPDATYDLVLCFEVIEHLERDPMFMLAELNRVTKPNGLLYMSTPNSVSARNVYKVLRGYAPHFHMKYSKKAELYRHNIEYAPHQVLALMRSAGFTERKFWTSDTFEEGMPDTIKFLKKNNYPTDLRGDNILYIGQRSSKVIDRFPEEIYY